MVKSIRKRGVFDEFFTDLEEEINEMREDMALIFEEAGRMSSETPDKDGSYFYGFSVHIGRDGKPYMEEFGNIPEPETQNHEILPEEPFSEIIEGGNEISIIFELPGVEEKDIKLNAAEEQIEIDAKTGEGGYHKIVNLPCEVKPDTAKATYKNGILEVKIKRKG